MPGADDTHVPWPGLARDWRLWEAELDAAPEALNCPHPDHSLRVSRGRVLCDECNRWVT